MDYKSLLNKIDIYKNKYFVKVIGETYFKRKIMAVEIENGKTFPTAILLAGIHAREYITTDLLIKMLDNGLFDKIKNFNLSLILMANPDGVELAVNGLGSAPENERKRLFEINGSDDFSLWKANGRGVDLNNNFDARFGTNVGAKNYSSQGYAGEYFESELESKAIADYTRKINPFFTISFHSKGEEIYYNFFQKDDDLKRDRLIAQKFAKSTGYVIKNPEKVSSGGYKDFCVSKLKIPSITIEVGSDDLSHPITEKYLDEIYEKNKNLADDLVFAFDIYKKYDINKNDNTY